MRYKKPSLDALLTALELETSAARLSGKLAEHLGYMQDIVHELESWLCEFPGKKSTGRRTYRQSSACSKSWSISSLS